jgi:hypothetical protein
MVEMTGGRNVPLLTPSRCATLLLMTLLLIEAVSPASSLAQRSEAVAGDRVTLERSDRDTGAPLFLEPDHWVANAIRRTVALGLAPATADPMAAPITLQHAYDVLRQALHLAADSAASTMVRGWLELLQKEGPAAGALSLARVNAGVMTLSGQARGGDGYFPDEDWEGAWRLEGVSGPAIMFAARGFVTQRVSWSVDGGRLGHGWSVPAGALAVAAGPVDLWAGRRRLHYGVGRGGGTVLGAGLDANPHLTQRTLFSLTGGGLHTREPFTYPSVLGFLGKGRVEIVGGHLPRNGRVESPFVVFGRVTSTPFTPRLTVGVNRGAIFGGRGNPITAGRLGGLLIGLHGGEGGEFENQVLSAVIRFRPPVGPVPLEAYLEWGMDDTAGAVRDTPAIIAGADLGAVPGIPFVSLGLETTRFPRSCCGNPIWYRSIFFRGSWADDGRLFAHPLGGHGSELLGHARLDLPQHGLMMRAQAFTRERGEENLFAPGRDGRSRGGSVAMEYSVSRRTGLQLHAGRENARTWSSHHASVFVTHVLGGGR